MLITEKLTVFHKRDMREIITDFDFVLNAGDKVAVIGEEGNGKSTLLKILYDAESVDYAEYSGRIFGKGLTKGYLSQETEERLLRTPLNAYFGVEQSDWETCSEMFSIAAAMGADASLCLSERPLGTFSGGEKVKFRLLKELLKKPDVLFLDEPSNDLDETSLAWLEKFINDCGVPLMFVSHDVTLLENTANVIVHIEQLMRRTKPVVTVFRGGYAEYAARRAAGIAKQTRIAEKERSQQRAAYEKLSRICDKVDYAQDNISRGDPHGGRLLKKKMKSVKALEKRLQNKTLTEKPDPEEAADIAFPKIALARGKIILTLEIKGENFLGDVSLCVRGGDRICITGPNGSGKTTLLKRIRALTETRKDFKTGYMPQDYAEELEGTPVEFLAGGGGRDKRIAAERYLGSAKFTYDDMTRPCARLSGGQKAKLYFLKMITDGAEVLLLDEPTRNLSPLSNPVIRSVLADFGGTVIAVTHDRKFAADFDEIYRLEKGVLQKIRKTDI